MPQPNGIAYYEQLKKTPIITLANSDQQKSGIYLAGVLPFYTENINVYSFLVRPEARKPDLPPPLFQIGKGTRMVQYQGRWEDWSAVNSTDAEQIEPLEITALREGEEELGLLLNNICAIYDAGIFSFISSSTGEKKRMAIFPIQLYTPDHFKQPDQLHGKSSKTAWLEITRDSSQIKPDHLAVIKRCISLWKHRSDNGL